MGDWIMSPALGNPGGPATQRPAHRCKIFRIKRTDNMRINQDRGRTAELRSNRLAIPGGQGDSRAQGNDLAGGDGSARSSGANDQISPRSEAGNTAWSPASRTDLFENPQLASMAARASTYLKAGIPIHLRGPAGTGKTTMAMQLAAKLGRPMVLLTGDDGLTAAHLIGR